MKNVVVILIAVLFFVSTVYAYGLQAVDDSYTKVLIHADGVDGSVSVVDDSGKTWTTNGDLQLDTAYYKFGGSSLLFDGTGDYAVGSWGSDFSLSNQDFTLDFWFRVPVLPGTCGNSDQYTFFTRNFWGYQVFDYLFYTCNRAGNYVFGLDTWNNSQPVYFERNASALVVDTWYHLAYVRSGSSWYIFQDGNQLGDVYTDADSLPNNNNSNYIPVIGGIDGTRYFRGSMDEFRLSLGVARWTSGFTPQAYQYEPTATATNTSIYTATSTATSTPTSTATSTPTSTVTSTPTSTATSTPTSTATSTPTSTVTSTPTVTSTVVVSIENGEVQYNSDGGMYYRIFTGLFFIVSKMYWEGLLYQFVLPYMVNGLSDVWFVVVQIILFIVLYFRRMLFDFNKVLS